MMGTGKMDKCMAKEQCHGLIVSICKFLRIWD
jgi:hypothetical protein